MRDSSTPLEGVIETFLWSKKAERISRHTENWYRDYLMPFVSWLRAQGGLGVIGDIDPITVRTYIAYRLVHGGRGPGSPYQARASAVALKSLSVYLTREAILDRDVLAEVKVPRVDDQTRNELSAEQFAQVVKAAERGRNGPRDKAILMLLVVCGLRLNEARELTLEDLDFDQGIIRVRPETSKFRKGRYVTLYPEAADALARYVYDHRDGNREYLFLTESGTPFTYYGFQRIFRSLKKRSGLPKFSAHILRHTASSSFMRAGTGNVLELQRQMGWSDVRMAMRYCHETDAREMATRPSPLGGMKGSPVKWSQRQRSGQGKPRLMRLSS